MGPFCFRGGPATAAATANTFGNRTVVRVDTFVLAAERELVHHKRKLDLDGLAKFPGAQRCEAHGHGLAPVVTVVREQQHAHPVAQRVGVPLRRLSDQTVVVVVARLRLLPRGVGLGVVLVGKQKEVPGLVAQDAVQAVVNCDVPMLDLC